MENIASTSIITVALFLMMDIIVGTKEYEVDKAKEYYEKTL